MQKVAVIGKTGQSIAFMQSQLAQHGFTIVDDLPDFVVSYGGDGMFFIAERKFPGVPKLLVRDSFICNKCQNLPLPVLLDSIQKGSSRLVEHPKLSAVVNEREFLCVNNFVIRNRFPTHALRFTLAINGKQFEKEIIGDGLVISTPYGSGAYFHSVSRRVFESGIGIAFNNSTKPIEPLILPLESEITIVLTRGDAVFVSDNDTDVLGLDEGQSITIKKSGVFARTVDVL